MIETRFKGNGPCTCLRFNIIKPVVLSKLSINSTLDLSKFLQAIFCINWQIDPKIYMQMQGT